MFDLLSEERRSEITMQLHQYWNNIVKNNQKELDSRGLVDRLQQVEYLESIGYKAPLPDIDIKSEFDNLVNGYKHMYLEIQ